MEVVSGGSGGRVLRWRVDAAETRLVLSAGYALVRQQVPMINTLSKVEEASARCTRQIKFANQCKSAKKCKSISSHPCL